MAMWTTSVPIPDVSNKDDTFAVAVDDDIWIISDNRERWRDMDGLTIHVYSYEDQTVRKLDFVFPLLLADLWACRYHDNFIYFQCCDEEGGKFYKLNTTTLQWKHVMTLSDPGLFFVILGTKIVFYHNRTLAMSMIDMETGEFEEIIWRPIHDSRYHRNNVGVAYLDDQLHLLEFHDDSIVVYYLHNSSFILYQGDLQEILPRLAASGVEYFDKDVQFSVRGGTDAEEFEASVSKLNILDNKIEYTHLRHWCSVNEVRHRDSKIVDWAEIKGLVHVILKYEAHEHVVIRTIDCIPSLATICYCNIVNSIVWKQRTLEEVLKHIPLPHSKRFKNMLEWKEEMRDFGENANQRRV